MSWWRTEAQEVIVEIRSVREQLAATLTTLQDFEERLRKVAVRQEELNVQAARREDAGRD